MNKLAAIPFALLATAALIAGCGSGGSTSPTATATASPSPLPTTPCTPPPGEAYQLAFPVPFASGAPSPIPTQPGTEGVIVAVSPQPLPSNWYIYVTAVPFPVPAVQQFLTTPPNPLPTPLAVINFPNPIYQISPSNYFAVGTQWTAFLANTTCFPGLNLGTFQT